jgi:hypothetical protein
MSDDPILEWQHPDGTVFVARARAADWRPSPRLWRHDKPLVLLWDAFSHRARTCSRIGRLPNERKSARSLCGRSAMLAICSANSIARIAGGQLKHRTPRQLSDLGITRDQSCNSRMGISQAWCELTRSAEHIADRRGD